MLHQSPFTGLLTSKLSYRSGKQSPVTYSRFDNITLTLPQYGSGQPVSLATLLSIFVSQVTTVITVPILATDRVTLQEMVEAADPRNNLVKQISFGKLPECLCFHIQRTGWWWPVGGGWRCK